MSQLTFHTFSGGEESPLWSAASGLRQDTFVAEQGVPFVLEVDARDFQPSTIHLLGTNSAGQPVAALRILRIQPNEYHVGRVVVARQHRGQGWGRAIIVHAAEIIANETPQGSTSLIVLDSQVQAIEFYRSCGYELNDAPQFLDANIPHRTMVLQVVGTRARDL